MDRTVPVGHFLTDTELRGYGVERYFDVKKKELESLYGYRGLYIRFSDLFVRQGVLNKVGTR